MPIPTILELIADHPDRDELRITAQDTIDAKADAVRALPARFADAEVTQPDVAAWATEVVRGAVPSAGRGFAVIQSGKSLLLLGETGTGKSHEAYAAMRALMQSGAAGGMVCTTAADVYARLRPRHQVDSEREFEKIAHPAVLFLDDLGAGKDSPWTEEVNYRLVNYRYERQLRTIITSNVPPKQFRSTFGDRVTSRIGEMCTRVVLDGGDRRLRGVA